MTPEQLWASLESQADAIEKELMQLETINGVFADAVINGTGAYTVGVDPDSAAVILGRCPDIMIVDECDGHAYRVVFEKLSGDTSETEVGLVEDFRTIMSREVAKLGALCGLGGGSRRSALMAMESCAPECFAIEPEQTIWHQPPKPVNKIRNPHRQSFRQSMRSVNRNR